MHLRSNKDMGIHSEIIPVWRGESTQPPEGFLYYEDVIRYIIEIIYKVSI